MEIWELIIAIIPISQTKLMSFQHHLLESF